MVTGGKKPKGGIGKEKKSGGERERERGRPLGWLQARCCWGSKRRLWTVFIGGGGISSEGRVYERALIGTVRNGVATFAPPNRWDHLQAIFYISERFTICAMDDPTADSRERR